MVKGRSKGIPVLMYHALEDEIHPAGAVDAGEQLYVLKVSQFREQMEYLHREGYSTFLLEELQALAEWPDKAVVLTFDDGHESNFTLALPILLEYGFKAEFFITTGWIGTPYFMNEEQIQGLHQAGMGIGSHGVTHRFLSDLPEADIKTELDESKRVLEACLGVPVESMSYPGGRMNQRTQSLAHTSGYRYICSSVPHLHQPTSDKAIIHRFAVTADVTLDAFASLVQGRGLNVIRFRHDLLATTKAVLGNKLYTRFRSALIRSDR
ncbi:MAG: polysaccharide deacetylase family protein [Deltaproteobacteria bacterium]|nr:polysaccharide deacetylase family protein [Deltaproteobacteria bacterium]